MGKVSFNGNRVITLITRTDVTVEEWVSTLSLSQTGEQLSGTSLISRGLKVASGMKISKTKNANTIRTTFSFENIAAPYKTIAITKHLRPGDRVYWEQMCTFYNGDMHMNQISGSAALFSFLEKIAHKYSE